MQQLKADSLLQQGKYRILDVLGQGGFGITYLAEQAVLERKVAVKEFFMKGFCSRNTTTSEVSVVSEENRKQVEKFLKKFIYEARIIASLDNDHIIQIYDVFQENGTAYYVMEYHPNGSLKDLVLRNGHLSEYDAKNYILQVAGALEYIHKRNILHLDVKPANILLDKDNKAVLIDFGVSKHYASKHFDDTTEDIPAAVSPGYSPIEQYNKETGVRVTPATDVYSLGATFYHIIIGSRPPAALDILNSGIPPLSVSISDVTRSAILAAMNLRSADRPQSIKEFVDKLDESPIPVKVEETIVDQVKGKSLRWWDVCVRLFSVVCISLCIWWITDMVTGEKTLSAVDYQIELNRGNEGRRFYTYTGLLSKEGLPDDPAGKAVFQDGAVFEGDIKDGIMKEGKMIYLNGASYEGVFTSENEYDNGTYKDSEGKFFIGSFKDERPYTGDLFRKDSSLVYSIKDGKVILDYRDMVSSNSNESTSVVSVSGVALNRSQLRLRPGESEVLTATVMPANASKKIIYWSSSDESVAVVTQLGRVRAVRAGTSEIKVTTEDGLMTATCSVTVKTATVSVTGVRLNRSALTLTEGSSEQLTAIVSPSNATNKRVNWNSSNPAVARVSSTGTVTAVRTGSAQITLSSEDGRKTAVCRVVVTNARPEIVPPIF